VKTAIGGWAEDDCALALRVSEGDADAEEVFVARFRGRVLAMAKARGCDADAASDITQETLLGVLVALRAGKLRDSRLLPRFVAGTARNLIHNHFRTKRRIPAHEPDSAPQRDAASDLIAAEDAAWVRQGLAQLQPDDRRLLELIFDHDLSTSAIAEQLRTSTDVVRQRKHRALDRLRGALGELSQSTPARHREIDGLY
jgi:RNA polymerase sigma-70 factor (ECF subfamily)